MHAGPKPAPKRRKRLEPQQQEEAVRKVTKRVRRRGDSLADIMGAAAAGMGPNDSWQAR
jgi:hypothetical protein